MLETLGERGKRELAELGGRRAEWLTIEKRNQLVAGTLGAEGESDGRETVDGIEAKENVVVLELESTEGSRGRGWTKKQERVACVP